jgi:hypothetical protein
MEDEFFSTVPEINSAGEYTLVPQFSCYNGRCVRKHEVAAIRLQEVIEKEKEKKREEEKKLAKEGYKITSQKDFIVELMKLGRGSQPTIEPTKQ